MRSAVGTNDCQFWDRSVVVDALFFQRGCLVYVSYDDRCSRPLQTAQ